ncbi:MAG: hypothetical protein J7621_15155 [Niastella sp.]|nr:hypothetical protein [Niastella sp.]
MLILKIMLFPLLGGIALIASFITYRYFNEKIKASGNIWQLLFYSCSLIVVDIGIILGGLWGLLEAYRLLR